MLQYIVSKAILSLVLKAKFQKNDNCSVERKQGGSKTMSVERKQGGSKTMSWTCPMISDVHIKEIDFQLPGKLSDDSGILDTVQ